jgi:Transposase
LDTLDSTYLDEALVDFSGYLAIDEVYDGPHSILSVVDNRRYRRLAFRVLEHDPTQDDARAFLTELKAQLDQRGLAVRGFTTDGSALYPEVLKELWPGVPHQRCRFHVLREITEAVLHALAAVRQQLKAQIPKQRWGRPRKQDQAHARRLRRLKQRVSELFEQRHLFVRHHLNASQQRLLNKLLRGQPQLRALRALMTEVYRLFDRRCRLATALLRLRKLRQRVRRFQGLARALAKLNNPALEQALLFLDDKLLPSTSNAVERSNRRFRKAQKSIYSVRSQRHVEQRLALDMNRELRAGKRAQTLKTLHRARSDPESGHCCCYSVENPALFPVGSKKAGKIRQKSVDNRARPVYPHSPL